MSEPSRISSFGTILVSEGISSEDHSKLQALGQELEQLFDSAQERSQKIDNDPELTSMGKARKKKVLTAQIAESLTKYGKLANEPMEMIHGPSWALELDRLQQSLQTQPANSEERVLNFLQQQEIRNYLRSIQDPVKIEAQVRVQAEQGNWQFLDAVKSAPEGAEHFILPKSMELLESKRLRSLNPEKVQRISEIQRSQRTLSNMVASLKSSLKKVDLFAEPDRPIQFLNQAS